MVVFWHTFLNHAYTVSWSTDTCTADMLLAARYQPKRAHGTSVFFSRAALSAVRLLRMQCACLFYASATTFTCKLQPAEASCRLLELLGRLHHKSCATQAAG